MHLPPPLRSRTHGRSAAAVLAVAALATACALPAARAADGGTDGAGADGGARASSSAPAPQPSWGLVIHGGAGAMTPQGLPPEAQARYRAGLEEAATAGWRVLERGGSSLDAVEAAIRVMEDNPLFNAGRGAVFTHEGRNELDASIMDGATGKAGAASGLRHVRNPITLARAVMEQSPHVMLSGTGAEEFARERGLDLVPASYFFDEGRFRSLQRTRERNGDPPLAAPDTAGPLASAGMAFPDDEKFGTVGAVALDRQGRLAAGTSTGGMNNKRWGRIGDAPIIGAGTYAARDCAVSATGHGEFFIRNVVAYDICALHAYAGMSVAAAADSVVMRKLVAQEAEGGVIVMDGAGNVSWPFNSTGMFRAKVGPDGRVETGIFRP